jgi:hypothetical protein
VVAVHTRPMLGLGAGTRKSAQVMPNKSRKRVSSPATSQRNKKIRPFVLASNLGMQEDDQDGHDQNDEGEWTKVEKHKSKKAKVETGSSDRLRISWAASFFTSFAGEIRTVIDMTSRTTFQLSCILTAPSESDLMPLALR